MSTATLLTLAGAFAAALVVNAFLLWLTCRWLNVRRPATPDRRGVTFRRALTLAACGLAATLLAGATCWALPIDVLLALNAHAVVSLAASVVILRFGLPVGWGKALGVEATWTLAVVPVAFVAMLVAFDSTVATGIDMADAVRGEHREVACPQCGYGFSIGPKADDQNDEDSCTCPNCRLPILFAPAGVPAPPGFVSLPPAKPADRVLVLRSALWAAEPERFDVVAVDRIPVGNQFGGLDESPGVLRVVGLPGERVALYRGDVYVLDPRWDDEDDEWHWQRRRANADDDFLGGRAVFREDDCLKEASEPFWAHARLVRKPPAKVLATMRLVYDSRHPAADLTLPHERRWEKEWGNGWRKDGIGFRHAGGGREAWLRYRHALRTHNFEPSLITDHDGNAAAQRGGRPGESWVGDLILECEADVGTSGEWMLELSRGPDRFQARFDLGAGTCTLIRLTKGKAAETLGTVKVRLPAKARVRFANVDERLTVWVNDRLVFGEGVPYVGPRDLLPVKENDLDGPASVGVNGAALHVRRLRLLRDVFFYVSAPAPERGIRFWRVSRMEGFRPTDPETWRRVHRKPVTLSVGADEYFLTAGGRASPRLLPGNPFARDKVSGKALLRFAPLSRVGRCERHFG